MIDDAIVVHDLTKKFNLRISEKIYQIFSYSKKQPFNALENISFSVKKGEVFGIIGLNGSGKTTLLRTMAGLYAPDSGSVNVTGTIAPILQIGLGFNEEFNAVQNIMMNGILMGMKKSDIKSKIKKILEFAELQSFQKIKLKQYSSGMKSRLAFSIALELNSDILLIDEILAVGDMSFRKKCIDELKLFKKHNRTIVHTTHSTSMLSQMCDRVLLLHKGKQILIDTPSEVIKKYKEIIDKQN